MKFPICRTQKLSPFRSPSDIRTLTLFFLWGNLLGELSVTIGFVISSEILPRPHFSTSLGKPLKLEYPRSENRFTTVTNNRYDTPPRRRSLPIRLRNALVCCLNFPECGMLHNCPSERLLFGVCSVPSYAFPSKTVANPFYDLTIGYVQHHLGDILEAV